MAYSDPWALERLIYGPVIYGPHMRTGPQPIPEGSMRVAPSTDAVVWRICPDYKAEL